MKDLHMVSVIIPAYNVEKYIERCLLSVLNQTYENIEVVVVDDGSNDNTLDICRKYKKQDKRIKLISIENHGVSYARNLGISKASGTYIMFVDADDYIKEDTIEKAILMFQENNVDLVCWNGIYSKNDKTINMCPFTPSKKFFQGKEIEELTYSLYTRVSNNYYGDYFRAVWGKLFLKDLITKNKIKFEEEIKIGEDALFVFDYLEVSKKVLIKDDYLVFHQYDNLSATHQYKINYNDYQLAEFKEVKRRCFKYNLDCKLISAAFWNEAVKDYILNELRINDNIVNVINKTIKWYMSDNCINESLINGITLNNLRSRIRAHLLRSERYRLMALFDVLLTKYFVFIKIKWTITKI